MLKIRLKKPNSHAAVTFGALLLLTLLFSTPVMAQKKGTTTTPPPAGSVFFEMDTVYGIRTDGTNATNTGLQGFPWLVRPSSRVYGTNPLRDRWFLRTEDVAYDSVNSRWISEVFAYHPVLGRVQVTNFDPEILVSAGFHAEWSNGLDEFISVLGFDVTWNNGQPTLNASHIFRLWIKGEDLDAAAKAGIDLMLKPADCEVAVTDREQTQERMYGAHHWSPDRSRVVYRVGSDLEVADLVTRTITRIYTSTDNETSPPRWSPTGDRILFANARDIYTIAPDGTALKKVASGTSTEKYTSPLWSPDAAQIAFRVQVSGRTADYHIVRAPATGGSYTILTGNFDKKKSKSPLGWVAN